MSKSYTPTPPRWQSLVLIGGALTALAAVELSCATYAWQTASTAQTLELGGLAVPSDVALKTAQSVAAGLCVALGPAVALHLWRSGRVALRRQAWLGVAAALVGLVVSTSNLSGYYAWTRQQHAAEAAAASPLYAVAQAAAARALAEDGYLAHADRVVLERAQTPATAARSGGDVARALLILTLVSGMSAAYRLPGKAKAQPKRRARVRAQGNVTPLNAGRR